MDINFDFENFSIKDIVYWPLWAKALGAFIVFVIVSILGTYFYIYPSIDEGKRLDKEVEKLKDTYKYKILEVQKLEKYKEILAKRDDYSVLERLIPNEPDTIQFVKEINQFGSNRQIIIQSIDPKDITNSKIKEFKVLPIRVKGNCDYMNLVNFITDIINMGRLVTFEQLNVISGYITDNKLKGNINNQANGKLSFELLLYTYFKKSDKKKK